MLKFGSPRKDEPPVTAAKPATAAKPLESPARPLEPPVARVPLPIPDAPRTEGPQMPTNSANHGESILAAGLTIEGKIEGSGNFRVVGRFKGTVKVNGELTIEPGAFIEGEITAESVLVAGDVRGQIAAASRVEFKDSGTLIGDVKASSVIVSSVGWVNASMRLMRSCSRINCDMIPPYRRRCGTGRSRGSGRVRSRSARHRRPAVGSRAG